MADPASVTPSAQPTSSRSDREMLAWIAVVFVVLSLVGKVVGGGFGVVIFGAPYLLACVIHLWIHRRALGRLTLDSSDLVIIFSSHIALLCGALLQEDAVIDGPFFVTVVKLLHGDSIQSIPPWYWFNAWAPFVGIPVALSWVVLFILTTPLGRLRAIRIAGSLIVPALALVLVVMVVAVVLTS